VAVASGPAVTAPYWPIQGGAKKYVLGATNPVWIDGDGDGRFTSAFGYASRLVKEHGSRGEALHRSLDGFDTAVAAQFASLARAQIQREAQEAYDRLLAKADSDLAELLSVRSERVKRTFADYLAAAPGIDIQTREERAEEVKRLKKEEEDLQKRREEREKKRKEEEKKKAVSRKKRV
jgi:succinate dehydrogenase flavin-adding protein (antitoxin of CptAB toxin-antitoxin module)